MKHLALALSIGAAILTAATSPAMVPSNGGLPPPPLDHMVCYSMRDPLRLKTTASFLAQLQPEFTQDGCILVKPIEFCVPATKLNVSPAPLNPNIRGAALSNDYICYKAKCPNLVPPPNKVVVDQFGQRLEDHYKLTKICVPARKRPAGCPVGPIVKGGPVCSGACPSPTQLCKTVAVGGVKQCQCIDQQGCTARPDAAGQCGGPCPPDANGIPQLCQADRFSTNPTATKLPLICRCGPPPPLVCGINELTGQCGGSCQNATDQCVLDATGKCTCVPAPVPCQVTGETPTGPQCGGTCELPGQQCVVDPATQSCSCLPPQCSQNPFTGKCDGTCADPRQLCSLDSTGHCQCQQSTACGSVTITNSDGTTTTTCGGPCPPGATCKADATGACNCQDILTDPCAGTTTCQVPCPGNETCSVVPGTNVCRCQCTASSCGTTCPAPLTCSLVPGTPQCACQ